MSTTVREELSRCLVRSDSTMLPVGGIWLTELEVQDAQVLSKRSTRSLPLPAAPIKKKEPVAYNFSLIPTVPKYGTIPGLLFALIFTECGRLCFEQNVLNSGTLPGLILGVLTAHALRKYPYEFPIVIVLSLLRFLGVSIFAFPATMLSSFFILNRSQPQVVVNPNTAPDTFSSIISGFKNFRRMRL